MNIEYISEDEKIKILNDKIENNLFEMESSNKIYILNDYYYTIQKLIYERANIEIEVVNLKFLSFRMYLNRAYGSFINQSLMVMICGNKHLKLRNGKPHEGQGPMDRLRAATEYVPIDEYYKALEIKRKEEIENVSIKKVNAISELESKHKLIHDRLEDEYQMKMKILKEKNYLMYLLKYCIAK